MRTTLSATLGAALALSGCSAFDGASRPAAYSKPDSEPWMLVTPPERLAVLELRESLERLPRNGAPMPAASGEVDVDRVLVRAFYEELQAEGTPRDRAVLLVEQSLERDAPVEEWTQVREFRSRERCETTKDELQEITREASGTVDYYDGMPLYELQWVFLEWSNRWARCIPVDQLKGRTTALRS
ncbi:MAG: hypothetical protein R3349_02765 [Geminicoccaceae bacterium]|nr:hypothetical protein [Geminicoccaceae bacterium]